MNGVNLLDCTLRDGGHVIGSRFGRKMIVDIIDKLIQSRVDIIELGFLKNCSYDPDVACYNNVEEALRLAPDKPEGIRYALLVQEDQYDVDKLESCSGEVEIIRVSFHDYDIQEGLKCAARIKSKGYRVYINPINLPGYSDSEIQKMVEQVNQIQPYGFTIVDTFGSMRKADLLRLYYLIDHNLAPGIKLGIHLHENLSLSYSLAQTFVELKSPTRDISVDGSMYGMGRIPGNLCIELIMEHMNHTYGTDYDIAPVYDAIDLYIMDFKKQNPWGYSCAYALSAQHKVHRTFAEYLQGKGKLRTKQIDQILAMIAPERRTEWDKDYIEELYSEYQRREYDDHLDLEHLAQVFRGKQVLLLAPGSSIEEYAVQISELARQVDILCVSANFVWEKLACDYAFFTNFQRWEAYRNAKEINRKIITSNLLLDGVHADYTVNFSSYAYAQNRLFDNCGAMLIKLMEVMGVRKIWLAGFDGFSGSDDFVNSVHRTQAQNIQITNNTMTEIIRSVRTQVPVQFVTPSLYEKEQE